MQCFCSRRWPSYSYGCAPRWSQFSFFAVYGVVGNAITHTAWTLLKGGYFPGLVTSLGYWVLGPLLLARLGLNRRELSVLIVVFAIVLLAAVLPTIDMAVLRAG